MSFLIYLVALASGAANPLQSGANAQLNKQLASPLWASLFVYASALLALVLAQFMLRQAFPASSLIAQVKPWAWCGGIISIASTLAGLILAQRFGSGIFTGLTVTASIVTSIILDHFGWIGFRQHTASPSRLAGCALMIAGLWLIAKFQLLNDAPETPPETTKALATESSCPQGCCLHPHGSLQRSADTYSRAHKT